MAGNRARTYSDNRATEQARLPALRQRACDREAVTAADPRNRTLSRATRPTFKARRETPRLKPEA
jgi:hypothetical protein